MAAVRVVERVRYGRRAVPLEVLPVVSALSWRKVDMEMILGKWPGWSWALCVMGVA